ncbi:MAG TPA: hypothetical protein ENJ27_01125 [Candidatus Moranbacteria bacterium]|nr:hypothetical protein [Candidatus Moranbacteria bacterium]
MKNIYCIVVVIFSSIILSGCVAKMSPYEMSYYRETRRLELQNARNYVRQIAWQDAQNGECYLHPFSEISPRWVSEYFDICERDKKWIFQQEIWQDRWRRERERQRGRRDAWRDFYNKRQRR